MKYFRFMFDYEKYDKATCLEAKDMYGINQYEFDRGTKLENWPEFTLYFDPDVANVFIDYQGNDLGWFIISSKFKRIIEELGCEGVQFLPIKIKNERDNSIITDYFVVNVYNRLEALDYEKTVCVGNKKVKKGDEIQSVRFYALKENKIRGFDIFKIKEDNCSPVFVSDTFKKAVEKNSITGCDFGKVIVTQDKGGLTCQVYRDLHRDLHRGRC